MARTVRTLRNFSIPLDPALARRTQLLVRLRAHETRKQPRLWALWVSCALSWTLGAASAPFIWRGFEWVGHHAGLPRSILQMGFVLWWALPALAAVAVVLATSSSWAAGERP